jgi:hypothetical protein
MPRLFCVNKPDKEGAAVIAYYPGCEAKERRPRCDCGGCEHIYVRHRVEVMPDLSKMSRHDRRTVEAIARKYGIEIGDNQVKR